MHTLSSRQDAARRGSLGHRAGIAASVLALLVTTGGRAVADDASAGAPAAREPAARAAGMGERPWLSIGVLAGSTQPDAHLADYQWDTTPRAAWGAQTLVGAGRFGTGLRLWRSQTTQRIDTPAGSFSPAVHSTSFELVGLGRLVSVWRTQVMATASVGRLWLSYDPDHVTVGSDGSGNPIVAALGSEAEWVGGGGLALKRPFAPRWTMGLEVERRMFGLDTAHRSGSTIVDARESFSEWSARLEVATILQRR